MIRVMTLTVPVINAALKTTIPVLTPLTPILGGGARQGNHSHCEDDNSQKAKFEWCVHRIPFGMGKSQWLESCAGSNAIGGNRAPPNGGMMSLAGRWRRGVRLSAWTRRHTDGEAGQKVVPPRLRIPMMEDAMGRPRGYFIPSSLM